MLRASLTTICIALLAIPALADDRARFARRGEQDAEGAADAD